MYALSSDVFALGPRGRLHLHTQPSLVHNLCLILAIPAVVTYFWYEIRKDLPLAEPWRNMTPPMVTLISFPIVSAAESVKNSRHRFKGRKEHKLGLEMP